MAISYTFSPTGSKHSQAGNDAASLGKPSPTCIQKLLKIHASLNIQDCGIKRKGLLKHGSLRVEIGRLPYQVRKETKQ